MELTIRQARPGDAERLAALMFVEPASDLLAVAGSATAGERFQAGLLRQVIADDPSAVLVAELDGDPVGFAQLAATAGDVPPLPVVARTAVAAMGVAGALRAGWRSRARLRVDLSPPEGSAHLVELQVSPNHRNAGIGRRLLEEVERVARRHGAATVSLTTASSNPARRLYERAGYRLDAEKLDPRYERVTGNPGRVLMVKRLPTLRLRPLRPDDEAAFRAAHRTMVAEDDFPFGLWFDEGTDWASYLDTLDRARRAVDVPEGMVPSTFLVADLAGEIVGRASIRHALNEFLAHEGGHIGYGVLPRHRGQGHATEILRQSLVVVRAAGVDRVLVTCDDVNVASARTIERCGGVLDSVISDTRSGEPLRRYWID